MIPLELVLLLAVTRDHPVNEICHPMTKPAAACPPEQEALLYTPHEHDAKGDLVITSKGKDGQVVRTTIDTETWLADKRKELGATPSKEP